MNHNPPTNSQDLPKRGPGRPKGSVNKFTGDLKAAILAATDSYENEEGKKGAQAWLEDMRRDYPKTFMQMVARLIPLQVAGSDDPKSLPINIVISAATHDDTTT